MMAWAKSGKFGKTLFLCVCVDPNALGTAKEFAQLYFVGSPESLMNGFIDNRSDSPNFQAQLGCQGFIMFDSQHKLATSRTSPWLDYRDAAFRDVEGRLGRLLAPPESKNPANAPIGHYVRVVNLTSAAGASLNGQLGEVVGSTEDGRFHVKLADGTKALKPGNLEDANGAPVGLRMKVLGLTSAKGMELNEKVGEVLGGTSNGRYLLKLSDAVVALLPANLQDVGGEEDVGPTQASVPSVGHSDMDAQHDSCTRALELLAKDPTVKALHVVRKELAEHFDEEETLLKQSSLAAAEGAQFSAFDSHVADHKRILAIADDALQRLQCVCQKSDALGGTVPRKVAQDLCASFVQHATLYDALYEGELPQVAA
eukprot:TRINITY_DN54393_c0_g1_i1.p1 TRINITY_DN54393_c0_g1~~TRINITY_DN54393_c0_g1_i1.p1  ORF type:complete len:370 (-),score=73.52 TRINITY_DN54393_c0_g1_i1:331-1440(-)